MRNKRQAPRRVYFARVEIKWSGGNEMAMIEDRSDGGFGLRLKHPIEAGSTVWIKHLTNEYTGTVKFCRPERSGFLIGVQTDESVPAL